MDKYKYNKSREQNITSAPFFFKIIKPSLFFRFEFLKIFSLADLDFAA